MADVWAGVTGLFREYGYRRSRNHARLKFLVKDWGAASGPRGARARVPGRAPAGRPGPGGARSRSATTSASARSTTGGSSWASPHAPGGSPGISSAWSPTSREAFGSGQLAATAQQKLVIRDVDPSQADELVARLDDLDLRARPDAFRKGVMACTGIEFCKLAIGETKGRAQWLTEELAARLPGFDEEIAIHVNGCLILASSHRARSRALPM